MFSRVCLLVEVPQLRGRGPAPSVRYRTDTFGSAQCGMSDFRQNLLLAALSATQLRRLAPHLEAIEMPLGGVLYESGRQPAYVYFPTSSIISLLYVLESGASSQLAVVGNDGVIGVSL